MDVSVVICTYSMDRYEAFSEAVESVQNQTYDDVEIVVVVDGTEAVAARAREDFGDDPDVTIHCNDENVGNLESINNGIELAEGDVVANIDDDVTVAPDWLEQLVEAYEYHDALAAGGRIDPDWVAGEATYIPEEFYFLIGVTHRGFQREAGEVRNTFGSNLSFRRDVVESLGGYPTPDEGRDTRFQAGETELCARLRREYGRGVFYVPTAVVYHKIFDYRTDPKWLVERAFWQGVSKRWMEVTHPDATGDDRAFLRDLLAVYVPERLSNLVTAPSRTALLQLLFLFVLLGSTGAGYVYGRLRAVGEAAD